MPLVHIGDFVRINGLHPSPFRGKGGVVTEVERDAKNRPDWDMCRVVIESRCTQYFPAYALDPVAANWNQAEAASASAHLGDEIKRGLESRLLPELKESVKRVGKNQKWRRRARPLPSEPILLLTDAPVITTDRESH